MTAGAAPGAGGRPPHSPWWRPCRPPSAACAASPAGPGTSPAPPVSPEPAAAPRPLGAEPVRAGPVPVPLGPSPRHLSLRPGAEPGGLPGALCAWSGPASPSGTGPGVGVTVAGRPRAQEVLGEGHGEPGRGLGTGALPTAGERWLPTGGFSTDTHLGDRTGGQGLHPSHIGPALGHPNPAPRSPAPTPPIWTHSSPQALTFTPA